MSTETFKLPKGFEKVLLVLAGMNLQAWYAGFKVSGYRRKIFNQEFMDKNFGEIHQNELKEKIQPYGYPDTGNGLYSHKLSYGDWYNFNVLQRIHLNLVEQMSLAKTTVLLAGIADPKIGVGLGLAHIIGRCLYSFFYQRQGGATNLFRRLGMALCQLANLAGLAFFVKKFFFSN